MKAAPKCFTLNTDMQAWRGDSEREGFFHILHEQRGHQREKERGEAVLKKREAKKGDEI
jgi:hypothetical protein